MSVPVYDTTGLDELARLRIYHFRGMLESCLYAGMNQEAQHIHEEIVNIIIQEKIEIQNKLPKDLDGNV